MGDFKSSTAFDRLNGAKFFTRLLRYLPNSGSSKKHDIALIDQWQTQ